MRPSKPIFKFAPEVYRNPHYLATKWGLPEIEQERQKDIEALKMVKLREEAEFWNPILRRLAKQEPRSAC